MIRPIFCLVPAERDRNGVYSAGAVAAPGQNCFSIIQRASARGRACRGSAPQRRQACLHKSVQVRCASRKRSRYVIFVMDVFQLLALVVLQTRGSGTRSKRVRPGVRRRSRRMPRGERSRTQRGKGAKTPSVQSRFAIRTAWRSDCWDAAVKSREARDFSSISGANQVSKSDLKAPVLNRGLARRT